MKLSDQLNFLIVKIAEQKGIENPEDILEMEFDSLLLIGLNDQPEHLQGFGGITCDSQRRQMFMTGYVDLLMRMVMKSEEENSNMPFNGTVQ